MTVLKTKKNYTKATIKCSQAQESRVLSLKVSRIRAISKYPSNVYISYLKDSSIVLEHEIGTRLSLGLSKLEPVIHEKR